MAKRKIKSVNKDINTALLDELLQLKDAFAENEISGAVSSMEMNEDMSIVTLHTTRQTAVRRLFNIWKNSIWANTPPKLVINQNSSLPKIQIKLSAALYKQVIRHRASWPWLRGVMSVCGSIFIPKSGYYLALRLPGENKKLSAKAAFFLSGLEISTNARIKNGRWEIAVRSQQDIITILAGMGLMQTALKLEEIAIMRSLKDSVNKQVNCDAANIAKSLDAAQKQIETIRKIRNAGLFQTLPENLKELALVREKNPSIPFKELGQMMSVPISKSTVEYRFKKFKNLEAALP